MSKRIGIYGGMFDPVHDGHVAVARHALACLGLEQLLLVPCKAPAHRAAPVAAAAHRLAMLRLAAQADRRLRVDATEIESEGISWTIRTIEQLRARIPDAILTLVLGLDAFLGLPRWKSPGRLFELAHLFVVGRGRLSMDCEVASRFGGAMAAGPEQMFETRQGRALYCAQPLVDASSSAVRESLGKGLAAPVPEAVLAYARQHGLYGLHGVARS